MEWANPARDSCWARPTGNRPGRPYSDLAQSLRKALAIRRHRLSGPESACQDQSLTAAAGQLLQWRNQAVAKLAAPRWEP